MVSKIYFVFSFEQQKNGNFIRYDLIVTRGKSKNNISRNKPLNNDAPVKTFQDFFFVEQNSKSARGAIRINHKNSTTRIFSSQDAK